MTVLRIPTSTDPTVGNYVQRTRLDGKDYELGFDWNPRDKNWYLTLSDTNGSPIVSGVKIVLDFPLLYRVVDERAPTGELIASDLSGAQLPPKIDDLGTRVVLRYYPAEDL